ncbi:FKBP-type peptidyl-prolyl cis-trans isomerase [Candidatus Norongarragalina meridionalis]|nr:FKBP-type peptidyl-prolyl cis-trans isomerase [Candidatus Norongarragalina meridionalis]
MRFLAPSLLMFAVLLFGCVSQPSPSATPSASAAPSTVVKMIVENGDTVAVDYVGTFDNGSVFDTSIKTEAQKAGIPLRPSYEPLEFTVGAGQMISGFDAAVVGMSEGQEKNVHLSAAEAYGERREDLIMTLPVSQIPADAKVGSVLMTASGAQGTVTKIENGNATIDFNSAMAGKPLNFRIIVRKITKKQG